MSIFVNQEGYLTAKSKTAVSTLPCKFQVIRTADQKSVFDGIARDLGMDPCSQEHTYELDFSEVSSTGSYYILADNNEKSHHFVIEDHPYRQLKLDLLKALYYQRCGCALEKEYAGVYTHSACHTKPAIFLSDYLSGKADPECFDMTGGWHDAGDFGRYVSPAAVALGHLLYAYELFPESLQDSFHIPESGNGMPDILNECLYELSWMLKMQAPDGGAYHKLTSFCHADFVMPQDDSMPFLIYPVSSLATADFAAVMALASRVYKPFLPDFSKKALEAARKAWDWLEQNPYIGFENPPGSNTGAYDDACDLDERLWASAEMLRTDYENTKACENYRNRLIQYTNSPVGKTDFGWTDVSGLASLSLLFDPRHCAGPQLEEQYRKILLKEADRLMGIMKGSAYRLAMNPEDFVWGSNMVVCNRSMLFILCRLLTKGETASQYEAAALEQLHYLLGRNALDISYVTGHGENAFKNPHNRFTFADGIELPMPGWVSGGPFKTPCDPAALEHIPAGTAPMKCYVDHVDSYSTNEITIYWNSPAVFMTAFFETLG